MAKGFYRDRFGLGNVYTCRMCHKRTRDTGQDEAGVELCYRCLKVAEADNAASDYGVDSSEHQKALKAVPPR